MPVHQFFNITGIKIYETNERDLVMEPAIKWAGNQNITVAIKVLSQRVTVQVKLQISYILTNIALYKIGVHFISYYGL